MVQVDCDWGRQKTVEGFSAHQASGNLNFDQNCSILMYIVVIHAGKYSPSRWCEHWGLLVENVNNPQLG